jgi:hypothetical protein
VKAPNSAGSQLPVNKPEFGFVAGATANSHREPGISTSSLGGGFEQFESSTAARFKNSNSSAKDFSGQQQSPKYPALSQRMLTNPSQIMVSNSRFLSPPRNISNLTNLPAAPISSGSTPSLYKPISFHHQSRADLGLKSPGIRMIARPKGKVSSSVQTQEEAVAPHPKTSSSFSAGRPDFDVAHCMGIDVEDELESLKHQNRVLKERMTQLQEDQELILDLNQLLLQKLYLLTGLTLDEFTAQVKKSKENSAHEQAN